MLSINKNESYVSILKIINSCFCQKVVSNIINIGSDDVIDKLVEYFKNEIKKETGIDISYNNKILKRLKIKCEEIKDQLLSFTESDLEMDIEGYYFTQKILRVTFNELCEELFEKYVELIDKTLALAFSNIKKNNCTIILRGDCNIIHIPKLKEIINPYNSSIHSEEFISIGAAILGHENNKFKNKIEELIQL